MEVILKLHSVNVSNVAGQKKISFKINASTTAHNIIIRAFTEFLP